MKTTDLKEICSKTLTFKRNNAVKCLIELRQNFSNSFLKPHDTLDKYKYLTSQGIVY